MSPTPRFRRASPRPDSAGAGIRCHCRTHDPAPGDIPRRDARPEMVLIGHVTPNFFSVLGAHIARDGTSPGRRRSSGATAECGFLPGTGPPSGDDDSHRRLLALALRRRFIDHREDDSRQRSGCARHRDDVTELSARLQCVRGGVGTAGDVSGDAHRLQHGVAEHHEFHHDRPAARRCDVGRSTASARRAVR